LFIAGERINVRGELSTSNVCKFKALLKVTSLGLT